MATYPAIAAVARALLRTIEQHCPRDEFASTPQFHLYQSHDFGNAAITEGFSLMLYRVTVNGARNPTPRLGSDGRRHQPALPLDLHFMLTPWAAEAERQLRLLGWAMRFIADNAIIPANVLNHALTQRERPAFRPDESVELFCDPPGLADYLGLWDKYKSRWQTSVTYVARAVMIESELTVRDEELVRTRDMRYGIRETPT